MGCDKTWGGVIVGVSKGMYEWHFLTSRVTLLYINTNLSYNNIWTSTRDNSQAFTYMRDICRLWVNVLCGGGLQNPTHTPYGCQNVLLLWSGCELMAGINHCSLSELWYWWFTDSLSRQLFYRQHISYRSWKKPQNKTLQMKISEETSWSQSLSPVYDLSAKKLWDQSTTDFS